jgi:DNA-binding beta-propeller fold protein YncE
VLASLLAAAVLVPAPGVRAAPVQDSPVALQIAPRPGTRRLLCAVDHGRPRTCARSTSLKLAPGRHAVAVWALDAHGRASARRTVSVVVPAPAPAAVTVPGSPVAIAADGGSLWVSNGAAGSVSRIDAAGRRVVGTIQTGGQLGGLAVSGSSLWVSDFGGGEVLRLDLAQGTVAARIDVGGRPTGIAVDGGAVWVANLDGYVTRLDAGTDGIAARIPLPSGASEPLPARGLVWLGLQDGSLVAVDPATNALAGRPVQVAPDVDSIVDTPAGLWVSTFGGSAALVDPGARKVLRRVALPGRGSGVSFAGGSVWVSVYDARLVLRLDPATGALAGAVNTGLGPRESAVAGGALWVLDERGGSVTPIPLAG